MSTGTGTGTGTGTKNDIGEVEEKIFSLQECINYFLQTGQLTWAVVIGKMDLTDPLILLCLLLITAISFIYIPRSGQTVYVTVVSLALIYLFVSMKKGWEKQIEIVWNAMILPMGLYAVVAILMCYFYIRYMSRINSGDVPENFKYYAEMTAGMSIAIMVFFMLITMLVNFEIEEKSKGGVGFTALYQVLKFIFLTANYFLIGVCLLNVSFINNSLQNLTDG